MLFIEYPRCSTCQKAKRFLDSKDIKYDDRNIIINNPTKEELDKWIKLSNRDINRFFNTSGIKYRQLNLKVKLREMSYEEKVELLSTDGMLVKRPILVMDDKVLIGFRKAEWENIKN